MEIKSTFQVDIGRFDKNNFISSILYVCLFYHYTKLKMMDEMLD